MNQTMIKTFSIFILLAALSPLYADNLASGLKRCSDMGSDLARLACFDKLSTNIPAGTKAAANTQTKKSAAASTPFAQALAGGQKAFGLEHQLALTTPEQITSSIVGKFNGWSGKTKFTLANGQIWQQTNPGKMVFKATAPAVTISKGVFGSYRMAVAGLNKRVSVQRIK